MNAIFRNTRTGEETANENRANDWHYADGDPVVYREDPVCLAPHEEPGPWQPYDEGAER